jgi:AcrR family transcriptional regulator
VISECGETLAQSKESKMTIRDELGKKEHASSVEHASPGSRDDGGTSFSILVSHGGREFLVTEPMASIFVGHARDAVVRGESQLVTLAHATGVELLLVTPCTPLSVTHIGTQPARVVWASPNGMAAGDDAEKRSDRVAPPASDLRQRVLAAAYPLILQHGVKDLGWDNIEAASGVSREYVEQEFGSRDEVVRQCLDIREREWTLGKVQAGARARGKTPEERLLAIFDVFDEWFHRDDYEACTFINVLVEMGKTHPLGRSSIEHLQTIRGIIATLAREANFRNPEEFAFSWHVLMKGSIINATEGDAEAALRAKDMGRDLIERFRHRGEASGSAERESDGTHVVAPSEPSARTHDIDPRWAF